MVRRDMETIVPIGCVVAQRVDEIVDGRVEVFTFARDREPRQERRPTATFGSDDRAGGTKCAQLRPKQFAVDNSEAGVVALKRGDDTRVRSIENPAEIGPSLGIRGEVANGHVLKATADREYVKYVKYVTACGRRRSSRLTTSCRCATRLVD